jgi:hypothetical protein
VLGRTIHNMPQIGELSPGIWLASGFGGHGLNTTATAGNLIARAIIENDDTWRLFLPFELIWAGGRAGRVAAQVGYWWRRKRDAVMARKARGHQAGARQGGPVRPPAPAPAKTRPADAMELPAVAFPAEPPLEPPPDEQPGGRPRPSRLPRNARRSDS